MAEFFCRALSYGMPYWGSVWLATALATMASSQLGPYLDTRTCVLVLCHAKGAAGSVNRHCLLIGIVQY